jgi:hypothetical protein
VLAVSGDWRPGKDYRSLGGGAVGEGAGAEGVHEQVVAHRQAVPRLPRSRAQHVGVEQAEPFFVERADAVQDGALEQQAEAAQPLGLAPPRAREPFLGPTR